MKMKKTPSTKTIARSGRKVAPPTLRRTGATRTGSATLSVHDDPTALFDRVAAILEQARARAVRAVNNEMVVAYWQIGREIVEHLQRGAARADYGDQLIDELAARLRQRFGRGFSTTNLRYFRTFFLAYSDRVPEIRHIGSGESSSTAHGAPAREPARIRHTQGGILQDLAGACADAPPRGFSPALGWSHYRAMMAVANESERLFYEIEAERETWPVAHLQRQIDTHLFARLLKSRDKAGVMDLAARGQVIERPIDALKDPYVLDFLALPENPLLRERDIETAILDKLQHFLLELGKGFAFVGRQRRVTFEDENFYIDLVFYNVVLKCYLLVDLKLGRLTHQDVGQMDSYVRLFDDQCTTEGDSPTIGLILCAQKNETVARYSVLHESEQLFAARYVTYLPSVDELQRELAKERRLLEAHEAGPEKPPKRKGRRP